MYWTHIFKIRNSNISYSFHRKINLFLIWRYHAAYLLILFIFIILIQFETYYSYVFQITPKNKISNTMNYEKAGILYNISTVT